MMQEDLIKNFSQLATSPKRADLLRIAEAGLRSVDAASVIRTHVSFNRKTQILKVADKSFQLSKFNRVFLVGIGKVALGAAQSLVEILGDRINSGFVISNQEGETTHPLVICRRADHPEPGESSVAATNELLEHLATVSSRDLVLCIMGGGGSSLLCRPHDLTCQVQNQITSQIAAAGADIREINTIRKHLSSVKGGQLAKYIYPASLISLIFSDVPGDDISMVASGPTVPDQTTVHDAKSILAKYNTLEQCQLPNCRIVETPKEEQFFSRVTNILVCSSTTALTAMEKKAVELGYRVSLVSTGLLGTPKNAYPKLFGALNKQGCVLAGGELTMELHGHGRGGRNTNVALGSVEILPAGAVFAAIASDGWDNGPWAGALVDEHIRAKAQSLNLVAEEYIVKGASAEYFELVDGLIMTGKLPSNISDLYIALL